MAEQFEIWSRDPLTGNALQVDEKLYSALEVAKVFAAFGFADQHMDNFLIRNAAAVGMQLERVDDWLEQHGAETVVAAWTVGAPAARSERQAELEKWWPALASALWILEGNVAEA